MKWGDSMKKPLIGVIMSDCCREASAQMLQGMISQAFLCKCNIIVIGTFGEPGYRPPIENRITDLIASGGFDGFIYDRNYYAGTIEEQPIDRALTSTGRPVMTLDSGEHRYFSNTVSHDFESFSRLAEHLITDHGYRRIYCLTGPEGTIPAEERLQAYVDAMKRHKLPFEPSWCIYGDFWKNSAFSLAQRLLSGELPMPEAVMCGNDTMADVLISALENGGVHVPEQVAVTGYDGDYFGELSGQMITTWKKSDEELGAQALHRLYSIITGKYGKRLRVRLDGLRKGCTCGCRSIPRESSLLRRRNRMQERYSAQFSGCDMLPALMASDDLCQLLVNLSRYTYLNYRWARLRIFLTDECIKAMEGDTADLSYAPGKRVREMAWFDHDRKDKLNPRPLRAEGIPERLSENMGFPTAYYISHLSCGEDFFGYIAISFGKAPITYGRYYIPFVQNISAAFEHLKWKSRTVGRRTDTAELTAFYILMSEIRQNMKSAPERQFTIDTLAAKASVSRSYFQRMYKRYFGVSPMAELTEMRIEKAKGLLRGTDKPVNAVAEECGYESYTSFVRQFRSKEGMTPTAYRKLKPA